MIECGKRVYSQVKHESFHFICHLDYWSIVAQQFLCSSMYYNYKLLQLQLWTLIAFFSLISIQIHVTSEMKTHKDTKTERISFFIS